MNEQQEQFSFSVTAKAGKKKDTKQLCLSLMKADTEEEVISILEDAGYWENDAAWRYYGDRDSNYNTIGNQASRPDAALVEKLVNSIDAVLMNECLVRGIDPEGADAPQTIREAVATFFEETDDPSRSYLGQISEWTPSKRTKIARRITVAATGARPGKGKPCLTISDSGEGQTPNKMPETFLSLDRGNKLSIPFVQGKYNMGGTGVLKFCSKRQLQLIVSRRNPEIVKRDNRTDSSDNQWGFTVVRREFPTEKRRSSVFTYLAPIGAEAAPRKGDVLRFSASKLPIFPEGNKAYAKSSTWGSLVKLYEYSGTSYYSNTHILRKDGVLSRVDLRLPNAALPIRLHECRASFRGHAGSFDTTMTGLGVRLVDDRKKNIELVSSGSVVVEGQDMGASIYVFRKGKSDAYRKNEGILFAVNGQVHADLSTSFFKRKDAGKLDYIADSMLVIVDCSAITGGSHEDLFMTSRDRLSGGELRQEIERALEDMLKHHEGLRALKEKRRQEEMRSRLEDDKPLQETLISLLKRSQTLADLFIHGTRIPTPWKTKKVGTTKEKPFKGKRFPTYFKFKDKDSGMQLCRDCHVNMRFRITFETDAVDDYLQRSTDPGRFSLYLTNNGSRTLVTERTVNLYNGIANLSVRLPRGCEVGATLKYLTEVTDRSQIEPFENSFEIKVKEPIKPKKGTKGRRKPPSTEDGPDRELPSGISIPNITPVREAEWNNYDPPFEKYTAMRAKADVEKDASTGQEKEVYDFYVNMDNLYLQREVKFTRQDPEIVETKFRDGMVLVGLALIREETLDKKKTRNGYKSDYAPDDNGNNISEKIEQFSKAIAPILLPMIDHLGALDDIE